MIDALVKSSKLVGLHLEKVKAPQENREFELAYPLLTPITAEDLKIYLWDKETAKSREIPLIPGGYFYGVRESDEALISCKMPNLGAFSEQVLIPRDLPALEKPETFDSAIAFPYTDYEKAFVLLLRGAKETVLLDWSELRSIEEPIEDAGCNQNLA